MNKKQLFVIIGLVLVVVLAARFLIGGTNTSTPKGSDATSTQTPSGTPPEPSAQYPVLNAYSINLPNALILLDSQGRRTGKDPVTGTQYHEISGTTYFEEGHSGQLYFSAPPKGLYTLYVLGGQTGQYTVTSKMDDGGPKNPTRQIISGDIQKGSMVAYTQNYDLANVPSSTLVLQSSASSTTSITSAPPHNLPPPPAPGH